MRGRAAALIVVALSLTCLARPHAQIIDRVLASVGGRIVTASDVRAARELGLVSLRGRPVDDPRAILERLVNRLLVLDEVERYAPPEPRDADVQRRYDAVRARFASDDAFESALRLTGMDDASLRQWVRNDLRIRAYVDQRFAGVVQPGPDELEQYIREVRSTPAGAALPEDEAIAQARELAVAERRDALIQEWIQGLRRRASISYSAGDL